jgi:conjugative relaxase-like TrwC/TraI family protein
MLTIARLGAGGRSADYYLDRGAGCEEEPDRQRSGADVDYYSGDDSTPGRWLGGGAAAVGLTGALDDAGGQVLRNLLDGLGPGGTPLVRPVMRADPRGLVPARPLVLAVDGAAAAAGVDPSVLIGDERLSDMYVAAAAAVAADRRRPRRPRAAVPADIAGQVAAAAGLDASAMFLAADGTDGYAEALAHVGDRVDVRRAGLDLTFSAPKSVSTLFALGDPEVAGEVRAAHRVAVEQTVLYLEELAARAMRGRNEDGHPPRINTDGWLAAAFEHATSRSDDPQLHTHVVVPNVVRGEDGRWSAYDTREVYRQALTGGYLYQAVLRGELTQRLGVRWGRVRRGVAEIDGVPSGLRKLFSTRRGEVVEHLERTGRSGPKAAQIAALRTRRRKSKTAEPTLRDRWLLRASEAGFDQAAVLAETLRRGLEGVSIAVERVADRVLGPRGVTERRSTFDRRDLLRAVCEAVPAGAAVSIDGLRGLATDVVRDTRTVALLPGAPATLRRYSTAELLATEQTAVWAAAARGEEGAGRVASDVVEEALSRTALSPEQVSAVRRVTGSGAGVEVVVGPAGAGKTAALAAARHAWTAAGMPVRGAALAALAARTLEDGAGIPATSLTRLLAAVDRHGLAEVLPPGGVLVVDEASMVATRQLARLIELTQQAQTKLVLVGDPAQLPEIEAGGLFAALAHALPSVRLSGNVRQREPWEREALAELRDGDVLDALASYDEHSRVHLADSTDEVREQIVGAYLDARTGGADVLMLASTRADARALNRIARERLAERGDLHGDGMHVRVRGRTVDFRVGDAVLVTVNDYRRSLYNGTRGVVTAADDGALVVRADAQDVRLPREWVATGMLEHGYALTCHRAQGVTVDVALLYASRSLSRESGYVGLSRGRTANHVFATWEALVPEVDADGDGPHEPKPAVQERAELAQAALVQRLETRTAQRLASEQAVGVARAPWSADVMPGRAVGR